MSSDILDPKQLAASYWEDNNIDRADFVIPRVVIGQPTSTKQGNLPGHFMFNTGHAAPKIEGCKLILPTKTRVLYGGQGSKSRCSSDNFYAPSPRIKNPLHTNCLECPLGRWGEDPMKDKVAQETKPKNYDPNKPLCNETYNLMMADKDWSLFFITFQKTQLQVVKEKLFSKLRYDFRGHAPYEIAFDMSLKQAPGASYYNAVFENFREAENKELGAQMYARWKPNAQDELAKQHEAMDAEYDKEELPF